MRCAGLLFTSVVLLAQSPSATRIELGKKLAAVFEQRHRALTDPLVTEYLQRVGENLARAQPIAFTIRTHVVESPEMVAVGFPGGDIYIDSRLMARVGTEAELAGVLAHTIGHITSQHGKHELKTSAAATIPLVFFIGCSRFGGQIMVDPMASVEGEADLLGLQYAFDAGYDPRGLLEFFDRLKPPGLNLSGARARAEELAATPRDYIVSSSDFERVQARLKALYPPPRPPSLVH